MIIIPPIHQSSDPDPMQHRQLLEATWIPLQDQNFPWFYLYSFSLSPQSPFPCATLKPDMGVAALQSGVM